MPLNAVARFDELFVAGGKTGAAEAGAVGAKGGARNDRHLFGLQ